MNSTQEHLNIKAIQDDLVFLKNGDSVLILQTTAVNFGLLSEKEQIAIIAAFAGLLNSLSFAIQILIRSKRLNISSYLELLDRARSSQKNPLLSSMMLRYRNFIARTIRENEVLDKQFYLIASVSSFEIGVLSNPLENIKKVKNILLPRRDHLIRQLAGIGLTARQLPTKDLIKLFFDIYNGSSINLNQIAPEPIPQKEVEENPYLKEATPDPNLLSSSYNPIKITPFSLKDYQKPQSYTQANPNTPFIVEELKDDYGVF